MFSSRYHYWIVDGITITVLTSVLIISWYKKLWIMYASDTEQCRPKSRISAFLYKLSDCMQRNLSLRIVVYFVTIASYCAVAAMQVVRRRQSEESPPSIYDTIALLLSHRWTAQGSVGTLRMKR